MVTGRQEFRLPSAQDPDTMAARWGVADSWHADHKFELEERAELVVDLGIDMWTAGCSDGGCGRRGCQGSLSEPGTLWKHPGRIEGRADETASR